MLKEKSAALAVYMHRTVCRLQIHASLCVWVVLGSVCDEGKSVFSFRFRSSVLCPDVIRSVLLSGCRWGKMIW